MRSVHRDFGRIMIVRVRTDGASPCELLEQTETWSTKGEIGKTGFLVSAYMAYSLAVRTEVVILTARGLGNAYSMQFHHRMRASSGLDLLYS